MKNMQASKFFILAVTFLFSCNEKHLSPKEYSAWVKDYKNGLHKKKIIDDLTFDAQYKPVDFILLKEGILSDSKQGEERKKELKDFYSFNLNISDREGDFIKGNVSSEEELNRRQYYFSFSFRNDIYLMEGENKIPCTLFHYERSYDLKAAKTFVLGFKKEIANSEKDKTLVIDSRELGLGIVKINFDYKDFNKIPKIKL
jgi:hypothetical protein